MRRLRVLLVMAMAGILIGATAGHATDRAPENVLFIGNSHTKNHGGLDWLIGNLVGAEPATREFHATVRASSGVTLQYHYENGAPAEIRSGDYDTVVLQGYLPGIETRSTAPFLDYARLLDEDVRASGARTVLFMTWPQGRGDWTSLDDFVASHRQLAAELGASVAPAGVAFAMAERERPDLQLLSDDEIHATWEGAYLAAATIYATLFERSPEGSAYAFGISPDDAAFLQRIAWQAVSEWQAGG